MITTTPVNGQLHFSDRVAQTDARRRQRRDSTRRGYNGDLQTVASSWKWEAVARSKTE